MLTFVETISLAGNRAQQNDDAFGSVGDRAWVIDGATDLHARPYSGAASDAAWLAQSLNASLHASAPTEDFRAAIAKAAAGSAKAFAEFSNADRAEAWELPTASLALIGETADGVSGIDLGDCRCFALDVDGRDHAAGSRGGATDDEVERAREASHKGNSTALLSDDETVTMLRSIRAAHNAAAGYWVFGVRGDCARHARAWSIPLARPAHILLATDGFSALVDRYRVYDAAGLIRTTLDKGLQELGRELRAIETADAGGAKHPRFKASDDATALLLRLS